MEANTVDDIKYPGPLAKEHGLSTPWLLSVLGKLDNLALLELCPPVTLPLPLISQGVILEQHSLQKQNHSWKDMMWLKALYGPTFEVCSLSVQSITGRIKYLQQSIAKHSKSKDHDELSQKIVRC